MLKVKCIYADVAANQGGLIWALVVGVKSMWSCKANRFLLPLTSFVALANMFNSSEQEFPPAGWDNITWFPVGSKVDMR